MIIVSRAYSFENFLICMLSGLEARWRPFFLAVKLINWGHDFIFSETLSDLFLFDGMQMYESAKWEFCT